MIFDSLSWMTLDDFHQGFEEVDYDYYDDKSDDANGVNIQTKVSFQIIHVNNWAKTLYFCKIRLCKEACW